MKPIIPSPRNSCAHEFNRILTGSILPNMYPMFMGVYVKSTKAIAVSVRVTSPLVISDVGFPIHMNPNQPPPNAEMVVKAKAWNQFMSLFLFAPLRTVNAPMNAWPNVRSSAWYGEDPDRKATIKSIIVIDQTIKQCR